MADIIPGILEESWSSIASRFRLLQPHAGWIHIDVCDGEFATRKTWSHPHDLRALPNDASPAPRTFIEIHLMVERPWIQFDEWLHTRADRFILHIESFIHNPGDLERLDEIINRTHSMRKEIILGIKREGNLEELEHYASAVNGLLFLGVTPGEKGETLHPSIVKRTHDFFSDHPGTIVEVDGGVNMHTLGELVRAGARRLVATSAISNANPREDIKKLREAAQHAMHP